MLPQDTPAPTCPVCGKILEKGQKRFCSLVCYRSQRINRRTVCETCGATFCPKTKRQRVCSTKCITGRGKKLTPILIACIGCNHMFIANTATEKKKRFCSPECYRGSIKSLRTCETCGVQFKPGNKGQRRCSRTCMRTGWNDPLACAYCGSVVTPTRSGQRYCSHRCATLARHEGNLASGKRIAIRMRSRCRKTLTDAVIARDGAICYLCQGAIDLSLSGHDLMGLTIDHVIPLSRGGPHTLENLRPAHRTCNSHKSSRTAEEYLA